MYSLGPTKMATRERPEGRLLRPAPSLGKRRSHTVRQFDPSRVDSQRNLGTTAQVVTRLLKQQEMNIYCVESVRVWVFLSPEPSLHGLSVKLTQGRMR